LASRLAAATVSMSFPVILDDAHAAAAAAQLALSITGKR